MHPRFRFVMESHSIAHGAIDRLVMGARSTHAMHGFKRAEGETERAGNLTREHNYWVLLLPARVRVSASHRRAKEKKAEAPAES